MSQDGSRVSSDQNRFSVWFGWQLVWFSNRQVPCNLLSLRLSSQIPCLPFPGISSWHSHCFLLFLVSFVLLTLARKYFWSLLNWPGIRLIFPQPLARSLHFKLIYWLLLLSVIKLRLFLTGFGSRCALIPFQVFSWWTLRLCSSYSAWDTPITEAFCRQQLCSSSSLSASTCLLSPELLPAAGGTEESIPGSSVVGSTTLQCWCTQGWCFCPQGHIYKVARAGWALIIFGSIVNFALWDKSEVSCWMIDLFSKWMLCLPQKGVSISHSPLLGTRVAGTIPLDAGDVWLFSSQKCTSGISTSWPQWIQIQLLSKAACNISHFQASPVFLLTCLCRHMHSGKEECSACLAIMDIAEQSTNAKQ